MKDYKLLLEDNRAAPDMARKLLERGYYAVPCGAGEDGKGWIVSNAGNNSITKPTDGVPPDIDHVLSVFDLHPGCGISVAVPFLRSGSEVLLAIDVDTRDTVTMEKVALIIDQPCPVKVGARGGTFFVRSHKVVAVDALLKARDIPIPKIPNKDGKKKAAVQSGKIGAERWRHYYNEIEWEQEYIDVLGTANRHSILPPTRHEKSGLDYRWEKFPGSEITLKLEDVNPPDLPPFNEAQLLLLFQWSKNPDSPIWQFIGQTAPGNFHQLMLDASLYMWHERFLQAEIVTICEIEAWKSCEDDRHYRERRVEINNAVKDLVAKFPEQKPARTSGGGPANGGSGKAPLDRVITNWLREKLPDDDTGNFNGTPHRWHEGSWASMSDRTARYHAQKLKNMAFDQFETASNMTATTAVEGYLNSVPARTAQPDALLVPFANGLLHVHTGMVRAEMRDDYVLERMKFEHDPEAICPTYDDFIHKLMLPPGQYLEDETYEADHIRAIETLEEFLGYCLVLSHEFRSMLFLVGRTSTGKSELMKLIKILMPRSWVSDVAMSLLGDDNAIMPMANSHLNISGEIGRHNKDVDTALLKITSGEPVPLKILYKDRFDGVVSARMIFHGNLPPDTTDSTGAIAKRMILLRTTDIPPTEVIPEYHKILAKEAQGVLNRWVRAYTRLLERGKFDPPEYSKEAVKQATEDANSVSAWLTYSTSPSPTLKDGLPTSDLFMNYREWCEAGKMFCYSVVAWGKLLTAMGYPSRPQRIVGGRVVNYRALKLLNDSVGVRY